MGIGQDIVTAIKLLNPLVGDRDGETVNETELTEFDEQTIQLWEAIGGAIIGNTEQVEYRETDIYDGTPKRLTPAEFHTDHFIPEDDFQSNPTYIPLANNKEDHTIIPIFDDTDPMNPVLDETRQGYRVIINDLVIEDDSFVDILAVLALERNEQNDIPDTYLHVSPGNVYRINQKAGQVQLYFEYKGCYKIQYTVINPERNKDSIPDVISLNTI